MFGSNFYSQTRFSIPSTGLIGQHIVEFDTCYIAANRGSENGFFKFMFHKISKNGDSLNAWTHVADTHDGNHSMFQSSYTNINNSRYISGRGYDTSDGILKGIIAKFNADYSQVLNYSNFLYDNYTSIDHIAQNENTLIATGQVFEPNDKRYAIVMRLDTNGVILWKKDFKDNRHLWNFGLSEILPTPDNGYILTGWKVLNQLHYYHDIDSILSYLIKIDSLGNEEWRTRIGKIKSRNIPSNSVLLSDSNYLISWTDQNLHELRFNGYPVQNDSNSFYLSKISKTGSILWEKDLRYFLKKTDTAIYQLYPDRYPYNIWQVKTLNDGNIAIIGNIVGEGFMLKITEEGEPIWYRKYYPSQLPPLSSSNYSDNGIVGIIETSDNGFLLTGYNQVGGGMSAPWGLQTSYLYKTDKYGCITEGCHKQDKWYTDSVQIVEDSIANAQNKSNKGNTLLVYPNPTNGNLTVKVPASYNFNTNIKVQIYDSRGKLIQDVNLVDYTTKLNLRISKGLYLIKFTGAEISENHKIIIY